MVGVFELLWRPIRKRRNNMKKRLLALSLAAGVTAFMTACGEETTNTDIIRASAADNVDSLPKCDKSYEGMLATIPSKGQILVCHQGEWENVAKTVQSSSKSSADSDAGCTAKENKDKSGVDIVCAGETITTLKNGTKGADGQTGPRGGAGNPGAAGQDGTGTNGKDLKLDDTDCRATYMAGGVVIYTCGDGEYLENLNGTSATLKTWNALSLDPRIMNTSETMIGDVSTYFLKPASGTCEGKVERWKDNDSWKVDEAVEALTPVDEAELKHNFAVKGTATLIVGDNVKPRTDVKLEPAVGALFSFTTAKSVQSFGGLCLTYSSEQPMELILTNGTNVARSPLAASTSKKTVDLLVNDFKPDSANVNLSTIAGQVKNILVKAVGSLKAGEYTNKFAVYELGAYGRCSGKTIVDIEAKLSTVKKGTFTDKRDSKKYNTVTIGDQTWFAENLDYDYKVHVDPLHDGKDEDPTFKCDTEHPCVEKLVYNYSDENKALYGGRLYSWSAAIDSASLARAATPMTCGTGFTCALPATVQGICPQGWHVPSVDDYNTLRATAMDFVGYNSEKLRALAMLDESAGGKNWLGFSAKLGGIVEDNGTSLYNTGVGLYLVLSNEYSTTNYYVGSVGKNEVYAPAYSHSKNYLRAIRCVKDKAKE